MIMIIIEIRRRNKKLSFLHHLLRFEFHKNNNNNSNNNNNNNNNIFEWLIDGTHKINEEPIRSQPKIVLIVVTALVWKTYIKKI